MRRLLIIVVLIIAESLTASAQIFRARLVVSDDNSRVDLFFGTGYYGSPCRDGIEGESELPPVPPTGVLDARFIDYYKPVPLQCYGEGQLFDIRAINENRIDTFQIRVQPGASGYPLQVSWVNRCQVPIKILLPSNPIPVDMNVESSISIASPLDSVFMMVGVTLSCLSDVAHEKENQGTFVIAQNYPNPFNSSTKFEFRMLNAGVATLRIFNIFGQEVATVVHGNLPPGDYTRSWEAGGLPSGCYFYRLQAGEFLATRSLILLR